MWVCVFEYICGVCGVCLCLCVWFVDVCFFSVFVCVCMLCFM